VGGILQSVAAPTDVSHAACLFVVSKVMLSIAIWIVVLLGLVEKANNNQTSNFQ
jgi:hypothetical protein